MSADVDIALMAMTAQAPGGWYDDPRDPFSTLRYWDGSSWTDHVAPRPVPAPVGYDYSWQNVPPSTSRHDTTPGGKRAPRDDLHWILPTGRSWQTITAGYVGLLSLGVVILGPAAVVLGVLGLRAASRDGSYGRGRAVFGIVTGCIGTFLLIAILLTFLNRPG